MSRERVPLAMRLSERFGNWAVRQLAREIEVSGFEHIPQHGPLLLVSNHISWVDPVLLACWLTPATGRPISDRKSTRLNSSHIPLSRMPSSA